MISATSDSLEKSIFQGLPAVSLPKLINIKFLGTGPSFLQLAEGAFVRLKPVFCNPYPLQVFEQGFGP